MKFFARKKELKDSVAWYPTCKHLGKQYSFGGFPTKRAAEARGRILSDIVAEHAATPDEETRILKQLQAGTWGKKIPTFGEFYERWIESKHNVKESTRVSYKHTFRRHILPAFEDKRLDEITPVDVQEWIDKLAITEQIQGKRKYLLSPSTVGRCFRYFRACMKQAEAWDLIEKSPTQKINLPRKTDDELYFLEPDDIVSLIASARYPECYLFSVLAMSGLRLGEALALRWKDIDYEMRCIKVTRAWSDQGGFQDPKTASSRRAVPLLDTLAQLLRDYYHSKGHPELDDLLFTHNGEKPLDPSNVRSRFIDAIMAAKVYPVTIHSLRHSYASIMLANGASIKALQHALGHSSATMTLNTYSHLIQEDIDTAASKANQLFTGGDGKIIPFKRPEKGDPGK